MTERSMTDHPPLTSALYSLIEKPESGKQNSVGRVDCKPQQGCWSKHFEAEYKLVCLQDIIAYDLVGRESAGPTWKWIILQTVFIL